MSNECGRENLPKKSPEYPARRRGDGRKRKSGVTPRGCQSSTGCGKVRVAFPGLPLEAKTGPLLRPHSVHRDLTQVVSR